MTQGSLLIVFGSQSRNALGHSSFLAVRVYNPVSRQWSIYGSSIKSAAFDPPLINNFNNGRGELYGQDTGLNLQSACDLRKSATPSVFRKRSHPLDRAS